ncbi:MAG: hypothetical protein IJU21_05525 [Bacteroidales bacterium]|nr:hypothetical protein [Bacteroidales bacterium]
MPKHRVIPPATRKLFLETMLVLIISEMADALCGVIDAMYIGKFLGNDAIAAHGVSAPVFTFLCIFCYLIAAAIQHACPMAIGEGRLREANGYFNIALVTAFSLGAVLTVIGMAFPSWTATLLGAGNGEIKPLAADYLRGIAPGTIPLILFIVLVPILQIEEKWGLVHVGSAVMAVSDIALDYINIHIIHGGMYGMGLATSISYALGLGVFLLYFAGRKRIFGISHRSMKGINMAELFSTGLPAGVRMTARMLSLIIINVLVVNMAGATAMAAMAIQRNISTVVLSAVLGLCGAVLTLTSLSYGKQDAQGMGDAVRLGYRHSFGIVALFATALFFTAPFVVSLYIDRADEAFSLAVTAVRWLSASMPLTAWNWCFGSYLHGIGKIALSTRLFIYGELVTQCFTALVLGLIWGAQGIFASFAVSQAVILLTLVSYRPKFFLSLSDKDTQA